MAIRSMLEGLAGRAEPVTGARVRPDQEATIAAWLLHLPGAHPAWHQYLLSVVHLRPIDGTRPANKHYPEAEYELALVALDPRFQARPDDLETIHHLEPLNVVRQFHGLNDDQARRLCELVAKGLVDG